jgi:hypothetical protein
MLALHHNRLGNPLELADDLGDPPPAHLDSGVVAGVGMVQRTPQHLDEIRGRQSGKLRDVPPVQLSYRGASARVHRRRARFSDPDFGLEECGDEDRARLTAALPRTGTTMTYVYDLGDWWEQQLTLEKVLDPGRRYPAAVVHRRAW